MLEIFVLMIIFKFKHFLADYPLQTPYMLKKFLPGWDFVMPLAAHAGVHGWFTFIISAIYLANNRPETPWHHYIVIPLMDFVVHFIMDRIKASPKMLGRYKALSADEMKISMFSARYAGSNQELIMHKNNSIARIKSNKYFWWALGFDQMVHGLTDLGVVFMLVS